jgi:hypothetical protein
VDCLFTLCVCARVHVFVVLGVRPIALHLLGKCCTGELHTQPSLLTFLMVSLEAQVFDFHAISWYVLCLHVLRNHFLRWRVFFETRSWKLCTPDWPQTLSPPAL